MSLRESKIIIVYCIALLFAAIAHNNIFNYSINFSYVEHVVNMDTLPAVVAPNISVPHWRALHSTAIHHLIYWLIIASEMAVAISCFYGAICLTKNRDRSAQEFSKAKAPAILGLTVAFVLLTTGFLTIGGEWFYLWLAPQPWSGALNTAGRLLLIDTAALVFLALPDLR